MDGLTIVTPRLTLSSLTADDAPALFAYRSDPDVCRYQTFEPASVDDARAFIEAASHPGDEPGAWTSLAIRVTGSADLIGDIGFHLPPETFGSAEIGVTLAPGQQGRGLASEALRGLLGHLFGEADTHRVFASVDPRNERSMALMRRVGMRQEAHFRESLRFKGGWADDVIFAMLASEWPGAPADSVGRMWQAFLASGSAAAADAISAGAGYDSWHFGTPGAMADKLVALVLAGPKRATAGSLWTYEHDGDIVPTPGDFSVVTDGCGVARCVLRTVHVDIVPFNEVGPEFAAAEGEGDLTLEYWREGHWRYFTRELATFGRTPEPDMPIVCERFEVVYPSVRP